MDLIHFLKNHKCFLTNKCIKWRVLSWHLNTNASYTVVAIRGDVSSSFSLRSLPHPGDEGPGLLLPEGLEGIGAQPHAPVLVLLVPHLAARHRVHDAPLGGPQPGAAPAHALHHLVALVGGVEALDVGALGHGGDGGGGGAG